MHAPADPEQLEPRACCLRALHGIRTTLIAAETTGRICFGVELNPAYVDVAIERWQSFRVRRPAGRNWRELCCAQGEEDRGMNAPLLPGKIEFWPLARLRPMQECQNS